MIFKNASQKFINTILNIAIGAYLYGISIGINYVVIPLFLDKHGLNKSEISTVLGAEICAIFIVSPLLPRIIAKIGMGKVFFSGILLRNILLCLFPLFCGYHNWIFAYFIYGIGAVTVFISFQLLINNICPDETRSTSIGVLTASIAMGIATGPLIIKLLSILNIDLSGYIPFFVSSAICSLSMILLYIIKGEFPIIKGTSSLKFIEIVRKAKVAVLAGMIGEITLICLLSFVTLFAIGEGVTEGNAKLLISSMLVGSILLDVPIGMIIDRVNKKNMLIVCTIVMIFCSQLLHFAINDFFRASVLLIFWFAAMGGIVNTSLSIIGEKFKGKDLIKSNSVFTILSYTSGIIAMKTCGISMDKFGAVGLTYALGSIYVLYLIANLYLMKKEL